MAHPFSDLWRSVRTKPDGGRWSARDGQTRVELEENHVSTGPSNKHVPLAAVSESVVLLRVPFSPTSVRCWNTDIHGYSDKVRLMDVNQKPWRWSVSTACAADSLQFRTCRIHASDRTAEATVAVSQIIALWTCRLNIFNARFETNGVLVKQYVL